MILATHVSKGVSSVVLFLPPIASHIQFVKLPDKNPSSDHMALSAVITLSDAGFFP